MIGLATIGQSPRDDVTPSMFSDPGRHDIVQAGALDDLGMREIRNLAPHAGEHPLVTRVGSGAEVVIAKERVTPLLERAVARLEDQGAALVCVLCTGEFELEAKLARIVYPDRLMRGVIDGLLPRRRLGVVMPHMGQATSMLAKWSSDRRCVELAVHSPYGSDDDLASTANRLVESGVELIVLDCMGYTRQTQRDAQVSTRVPVVLANRLVGAVIEALAEPD